MFEDFTAAALIDAAMGEATRDESAAVARRFALIGQLDARRARELAERNWWRTDPYEEVAAEISAAQNISRGRASGQIHYARVLRDELPEVAAVFATGNSPRHNLTLRTSLPAPLVPDPRQARNLKRQRRAPLSDQQRAHGSVRRA